jgi:hypothetical protein
VSGKLSDDVDPREGVDRSTAFADSQSFLNHFRHLGMEVYPDHGAGRVAVRDRFAQRPLL